ncbi:MAG: histidinol-phosphatase [Proteobacteria bacterium]|nr:histidinol-phosphatase [Pseudomonadota bacterium]
MDRPCPTSFIRLATELAELSGEIIRRYFRTPLAVETKDDTSPVTAADREAEAAMRQRIETAYPDHGVIGEEFGPARADAEYVWVLDPIDGTKSFISGKPLFGTLIGLVHQGAPILGVIDHPALDERWIGARGEGSTFNGDPVKARPCPGLGEAILFATSPFMFEGADADAFDRLCREVKYPLFGTDCYGYGLLASGFADLVVEAKLRPYDYVALVPVVEGAGGVMTDWGGRPLNLASDGRVIAAGDRRTHEECLKVLGQSG